jgi:hypothetical protein
LLESEVNQPEHMHSKFLPCPRIIRAPVVSSQWHVLSHEHVLWCCDDPNTPKRLGGIPETENAEGCKSQNVL